MEYVIYALMVILLVYIIYRNYLMIKMFKKNKRYIDCYQSLLRYDEDASAKIDAFLAEQKDAEYLNKGKILKLYQQIRNEESYLDTLNELDLNGIFFKKGKASKQKISLNADVFVWLYLILAIARKKSKFDVIDAMKEKIEALGLENRLEVKETRAILDALYETGDGGAAFLNDILEGNYIEYEYDKSLIAIFKRFAAATLAYASEPIEEYYQEELRNFAGTLVGENYMNNLDIIEKYPPHAKEEENKE
ncbi:MAG: hypothetical protein IJL85_04710 [Erysipelotrichaceae bacterium]|nr:hypothetical protein [Erysipelotrichaceae bacterium]